jgi:microcompartment protein CcmL/EutN
VPAEADIILKPAEADIILVDTYEPAEADTILVGHVQACRG